MRLQRGPWAGKSVKCLTVGSINHQRHIFIAKKALRAMMLGRRSSHHSGPSPLCPPAGRELRRCWARVQGATVRRPGRVTSQGCPRAAPGCVGHPNGDPEPRRSNLTGSGSSGRRSPRGSRARFGQPIHPPSRQPYMKQHSASVSMPAQLWALSGACEPAMTSVWGSQTFLTRSFPGTF